MPSQADKIMAYMEHRVEVAGYEALRVVADETPATLRELTPNKTGVTAKSWRQTRTGERQINLHAILPSGNSARYLIALNEGTAKLHRQGLLKPALRGD